MDRSVGRFVSILYRKNQVYLNIVLKPLNLTASELPTITYLLKHADASQEELSSYLQIDKAATARVVSSLVRKGFLRKEKNTVDRRANRIYLTDSARDMQECLTKRLRKWTEFLTEDLDERSVDIMYMMLEEMVNKVEQVDLREVWRDE